MKKALLALALTLASCTQLRPKAPALEAVDARDSVYKAEVTLVIDIKPLLEKSRAELESLRPPEKGEKDKKTKRSDVSDEEVNIRARDSLMLSDELKAMDARVISFEDGKVKIGWSGTAWVAAHQHGRSFLMTAGHVCESRDEITVPRINWITWEEEEITLEIVSKEHAVLSRDDVRSPVTVIADEDLDEKTMSGPDMCLVGAQGDFGPVLPLGDSDPAYGSHAEVIGAPAGLWGGNIAVVADLKFTGRGNVWGGGVSESLAFTGDVVGGNSGSAIMKDGKVVALLNLSGTRFKELTTGIPHEVLRDFLRRHLHKGPRS